MKIDVKTVAAITDSDLAGEAGHEVSELLIDSRKVSDLSEGIMFIALKGDKHDGHNYIPALYESGLRVFLVNRNHFSYEPDKYPGAAFIVSDNSLSALQKLAAWKRDQYQGRLISVTGSNGKTIIKEWLSGILGKYETVIRSPRSYNSQVGVPLSLWALDNEYHSAVIEAGMSEPGEIARLEKMIKPDIGIFTHIGEAHQENFASMDEKVKEKLGLFVNAGTIIYPFDKEKIRDNILKDGRLKDKRLFTWSVSSDEADVLIRPDLQNKNGAALQVVYKGNEFLCRLPFTDGASLDNISTLIAVLLFLGLDRGQIAEGVEKLQAVAMRMERKDGINNCLLLEDYYNSDPGSLRIALDYLKGISDRPMTLILSDFVQGSRNKEQLYREVADNIRKSGVKRFIGIGSEMMSYRDYFSLDDTVFYEDTPDFISSFSAAGFRDEAVLIKGARRYEFERIGRLLELKTHQTQLTVNLNAVLSNLNTFRSYLDKGTALMAMVKAFAYGAGAREISEWLAYNGVDFLAVAYTDEGVSLRDKGITKRIMVMNPDMYSLGTILEYDLEPEIYSQDILDSFIDEAERYGVIDYPIHIKLDTGMHRLGFMKEDIDRLLSSLQKSASVKIASVFSHLAAAWDSSMDDITHRQAAGFKEMSAYIQQQTGTDFLRHLLNSAGIVRFPEYHFDMVRLGIGLYGISETEMDGLKTAASFRTRISQVKTIKAGEGVGYGLKDAGERSRTIAILPVGYADGLRRLMGQGRGSVYAGGHYLPVTGNVCMDMCMVDITGTGLKAGDEAEIFGENISIDDVAAVCDTIPYEILAGIPSRVKRIFLYE
ncbi:MAG: bifunctional UDP-N-acetylmuramoyl-tripeptide:D-alanyl-D-alanine ligase/alanine racemase [Bacteroidales bacterium]